MSSDDDDKLTPKQAAKYLGITTRTLRNYAKTPGFPKPLKASRKNIRYSRAELAAWLERGRSSGGGGG